MLRLFNARKRGSVTCQFTVIDTKSGGPLKGFEKLKAASGQRGNIGSWQRGLSPIPRNEEVKGGVLYLHLSPGPLQPHQSPGKAGIGEFWHISGVGSVHHIVKDDHSAFRSNIGLHMDNSFPGSAGCVVLTNRDEWLKLSGLLWELKKDGIMRLEFNSIFGEW